MRERNQYVGGGIEGTWRVAFSIQSVTLMVSVATGSVEMSGLHSYLIL